MACSQFKMSRKASVVMEVISEADGTGHQLTLCKGARYLCSLMHKGYKV